MKTITKKLAAFLIISGCALLVNTQLVAQAPVSKSVQLVANKKMFDDKDLMKSNIHAITIDQSWTNSKGVTKLNADQAVGKGNVRSTGASDLAVSKGVHQIKKTKPAVAPTEPFKTGPEITKKGK